MVHQWLLLLLKIVIHLLSKLVLSTLNRLIFFASRQEDVIWRRAAFLRFFPFPSNRSGGSVALRTVRLLHRPATSASSTRGLFHQSSDSRPARMLNAGARCPHLRCVAGSRGGPREGIICIPVGDKSRGAGPPRPMAGPLLRALFVPEIEPAWFRRTRGTRPPTHPAAGADRASPLAGPELMPNPYSLFSRSLLTGRLSPLSPSHYQEGERAIRGPGVLARTPRRRRPSRFSPVSWCAYGGANGVFIHLNFNAAQYTTGGGVWFGNVEFLEFAGTASYLEGCARKCAEVARKRITRKRIWRVLF